MFFHGNIFETMKQARAQGLPVFTLSGNFSRRTVF
jgi:hypothetical protein